MRRQAVIGAALLVAVGVVLGGKVFRSDIAQATGVAQSVAGTNRGATGEARGRIRNSGAQLTRQTPGRLWTSSLCPALACSV
jgi:hypothetical protein